MSKTVSKLENIAFVKTLIFTPSYLILSPEMYRLLIVKNYDLFKV